VSALTSHLDDRVEAAAANAVAVLAARHGTAARTLLRGARKQRDPLVLVCVLLGAIAPSHKLRDEDVRVLELALAHDNARVRRAAVDALAHSRRSAAAEAVAFALSDEEQEVRLAAVRALGRLGRIEPLVELAGAAGADPVVLAAALRVLGEVDPPLAVDTAGPLVHEPDAAVACAAVEVLGRLAPAGSGRVAVACERAMLAALEHPDPQVVKLSLSLLGSRPVREALARVAGCLDHRSWEVRRAAAERLGRERMPGAEALLRARFSRETDPVVRDAIAEALSVRPLEPARAGGGEGA
jgi:HEAT repeat protein